MSREELKVVRFPEPILRRKARKVPKVTDKERLTLDEMAKAMYLSQGVGLAAVQVGIDRCLAVVDTGEGLIKMVNPTIIKREGTETQEEGCLSCPGACVKVKRAKKVVVSYLTEEGEVAELKAEGLLARAIQHEIDHLGGTLIIDYLSPIKKILFRAKRPIRRRAGR
jgi:peptide deformylase